MKPGGAKTTLGGSRRAYLSMQPSGPSDRAQNPTWYQKKQVCGAPELDLIFGSTSSAASS
jgi:hypothetical protein